VDTDGDTLDDGREVTGWDLQVDFVGDGTRSLLSVTSDPLKGDSDYDGLTDAEEWFGDTNPRTNDTDDDGRLDYDEYSTAQTLPDSYDGSSLQANTEPASPSRSSAMASTPPPLAPCPFSGEGDSDCDGLIDWFEWLRGTSANKWDTDGDGLGDGAEVWMWRSNPLSPDTDKDSVIDGMDIRPIEEDQHPLVAKVTSDDFRTGVEITIADQSTVTFLESEMRFYGLAGYQCAESFTYGAQKRVQPQTVTTEWGSVLHFTEFRIQFLQDEYGSKSIPENYCEGDFIAVIPFRDAEGNTIQVEVTARANTTCHVDPLKVVDLGLGIVGGPVANVQTARRAVLVYETTVFGFSTAEPDILSLGMYAYGVHGAYTDHVPRDFVGPRQPSSATGQVLRWIGPAYSFLGIITGDYMTCDHSTQTGTFSVITDDEDTVVTDVRGVQVLMDSGVTTGRAHAASTSFGDGWVGLGESRAGQDSANYKAWFRKTLEAPVDHYPAFQPDSWAVTYAYHVFCPADESGGYVVTTEPRPGSNRALFVTAYPAFDPAARQHGILAGCPEPAPILP
jgi:hypothetical protein